MTNNGQTYATNWNRITFLVGLSGSGDILGKKCAWLLLSVRKFVLHPLIHTLPKFVLTQNMVFFLTKHSIGFLMYILSRLAPYRLRYYWKKIISKDS